MVRSGEIHGLIGPNGSGKTTTLNVISGFYKPQHGSMTFNGEELPAGYPHNRAGFGIGRTYQTPKIIGEASLLDNVMLGGVAGSKTKFIEAIISLPRHRNEEIKVAQDALRALHAVGLENFAAVRADRLQHSELRFLEIARALMGRPKLLMLDEPAAGLSSDEIKKLGELIKAIAKNGTSVLLVEHHADFIFSICDHVTVLNLGKPLASDIPSVVRAHKEVVSAYLGT